MAILTTTAGKYLVFQTENAWAIQADKPQSAPIGAKVRTVALPKGIVQGYDELYWLPGTPETYPSQSSCRPAQKVLRPNKYVAKWEQAMIDAEAARKAATEATPTVVLGARGKVLAKAELTVKESNEVTLTEYIAQSASLKMNELRAIGNTLGVKARSKAELAKKIWLVKHGQLEVKQPKAKKTTPKKTEAVKPELKIVPTVLYTYDCLVSMKMPDLRAVGYGLNVKGRSKVELTQKILDAYNTMQAVEAVTVAVAA